VWRVLSEFNIAGFRELRGTPMWDFILAGLVGLIDLNPFLDLLFTPLAWFITFWK